MTHYYPVSLNLHDKPCLVVGAGEVALWKISQLLETGAQLTVVAPQIHPDLPRDHPRLSLVKRGYRPADLEGQFLVIAATNDVALNHEIHQRGEARNMLVNVVDDTPHCNFILPSIARQGPLTVAVSSSGTSPTLARRLREQIAENLLTPSLARLAEFLGSWRTQVHPHLPTFPLKKTFWQRVLASRLPQLVEERRHGGAMLLLEGLLNEVRLDAGHPPVSLFKHQRQDAMRSRHTLAQEPFRPRRSA